MNLLRLLPGLLLCTACLRPSHQAQPVLVTARFPACIHEAPILTYIFLNPNAHPVTVHPAGLGFGNFTSITALKPPELIKIGDKATTLPQILVIPANGQIEIQTNALFFSRFKLENGERYQVKQIVFSYGGRRVAPLLIQNPTVTFRMCE